MTAIAPNPSASTDYILETKQNSLTCHGSSCLALKTPTSTLTLINTFPETDSDFKEFSDGGLRGWLAVFGAFLALFATFGQMSAFGTFQSWYATHQLAHLPPSTISWIGSLQLWMFFFSGGPIGRLYDSFGPTTLMIVGTIIFVFGNMMTSISTRFYQYVLCQGLVFGLGVGMLFYPCMASVSTHFKKLQGTALGIVASGSSLGGVIFPIMLRQLFDKVGFGWAVRISGLISALCCVIAVLTVSTRLPPAQRNSLCVKFSGFTDARFVLLTLGGAFVALGLFIPFFYLADFARDIHLSNMSFYVLAVLNGGGFFGRIAPSWLSDTFGRFNLLFPSAFLSGLLCLTVWILSREIISIMFFAAFYGFFSGAFVSLITPCVIQISNPKEIGTRLGTLYTIISFPSLLGGPIAGFLLARAHGSYVPMSAFAGSVIITGSMLILSSKLRIDSRLLACV